MFRLNKRLLFVLHFLDFSKGLGKRIRIVNDRIPNEVFDITDKEKISAQSAEGSSVQCEQMLIYKVYQMFSKVAAAIFT